MALSETTLGNLRCDSSNSSTSMQYISSVIGDERTGKIVEKNEDTIEINGSKIEISCEVTEKESMEYYESNPIDYIGSAIYEKESNGEPIVGDFWRASAEIKNDRIFYRLDYITGEHQKDTKGIEQNKTPFVLNIEKVDDKTFDKISKMDFTEGIQLFTKNIEKGLCSDSHLNTEHVDRSFQILRGYSPDDDVVSIYKETKLEDGIEKESFLILRESGLMSIHPIDFIKRYDDIRMSANFSDYKYAMSLKPTTMYYAHESRMMFYEKMSDSSFRDTLVDNMNSENPIEQIFYATRDSSGLDENNLEQMLNLKYDYLVDSEMNNHIDIHMSSNTDTICMLNDTYYDDVLPNEYDRK